MKLTQAQRKAKGIEILKRLRIHKPYINAFKNEDIVTFFERFGGYWVWQEENLQVKYKELEQKYNFTVYAIVHSYIEDMELWSMLVVPEDEDDNMEDLCISGPSNNFYVFSYTWNVTEPDFSEFGDIIVKSAFGGLSRIG